ncbi:MAG: YdcF family protein [bacterium]
MLPLYRFIEIFLFPPGIFLLLGAFGWYVVKRRRRVGQLLLALSLGGIWAFSTPLVSFFLLDRLQDRYPPLIDIPPQADSIVVLGSGREVFRNEFSRELDVTMHELMRVRYAAYLTKKTGLPVITSGGRPLGGKMSEALLMKEVLQSEFGVQSVIPEGESSTTYENARFSKKVLEEHGLSAPLVVTEYSHMARAILSFNLNGVTAFAAPTARDTPDLTEKGVWAVLPQGSAMERSQRALHEWFGRIWYKLKF